MKLTVMAALLLAASLAAAPPTHAQQSPANSGAQQPAPKPAPKKKPEEPIDPETTAGVRGPGGTHTVRVLRKGKPAEGAHVVVKNTNGALAATCYTSATGECQVSIGADQYAMQATLKAETGSLTLAVTDDTGPIVLKLTKAKPPANSAKPQ